jgi:hypothetical protein
MGVALISPSLSVALTPLPSVPSASSIFKGTQTTTVNEDTTVFTEVDIGVPHPKRVVVLGLYGGNSATVSATVNGIPPAYMARSSFCAVAIFPVPVGETALITVTTTFSQHKVVAVWIDYPQNDAPLDSAANVASGITPVTLSDLKVQYGGVVFFACFEPTAVETFTVTWTGTDAVIVDVNSSIESFSSYVMGRIPIVSGSDLDDLTVSVTNGGGKRLSAVSLGPSPPTLGN